MNKVIAYAILSSLNTLLVNCALSVQVIAGFLEVAEAENRDLTEDEINAIIDLKVEEQKKAAKDMIRNIIYE